MLVLVRMDQGKHVKQQLLLVVMLDLWLYSGLSGFFFPVGFGAYRTGTELREARTGS